MVRSEDIACDSAAHIGHGLAGFRIEITSWIGVPDPVAYGDHSVELHPVERLPGGVHLDTGVTGIHSAESERIVLAGKRTFLDFAGADCCLVTLVHPLGIIQVDVHLEVAVVESVTEFHRTDLGVLGLRIDSVACGGLQEDTVGEEGRAGNETAVHEHIVVLVDVVVHAGLDGSADKVFGGGTLMVLVIVEIVALPIAGVVERTGEHGSQSVVESGVFKLCEYAFLCGEPVVIPVDNIAYSKFLEFPVGIESGGVVLRLYRRAVLIVHVIFAVVKVHNLVVVVTDVITHIYTAGEREGLGDELVLVGGYDSVPFMVVVRRRHDHI